MAIVSTTIKYDHATFTDALDALRSPGVAKFTEFVKGICESSTCSLDVVLKKDEFGQYCFSINGSVPKVFAGYNYAYAVKLFMDSLTAVGYFK